MVFSSVTFLFLFLPIVLAAFWLTPARWRTPLLVAASWIFYAWGEKALAGYLGADRTRWREYDATALIEDRGWDGPPFLVDQGTKDQFLESQLKPDLLRAACIARNVALDLRMQDGYDHSYFFISSFIEDHLRFHARHL